MVAEEDYKQLSIFGIRLATVSYKTTIDQVNQMVQSLTLDFTDFHLADRERRLVSKEPILREGFSRLDRRH